MLDYVVFCYWVVFLMITMTCPVGVQMILDKNHGKVAPAAAFLCVYFVLFRKLAAVQLRVQPTQRHQLAVRALLGDVAVAHD